MSEKRFKRLSHSLYECKYPVVFCPKYRKRIFRDEIARFTTQLLARLCQQKEGVEALKISVQVDHVHLVLELPPKYAISEIMGYLKGKSAVQLFQQYETLARGSWGRHLWARGYCVSTIGLDELKIRKYVQWQEGRERRIEAQQRRLFD